MKKALAIIITAMILTAVTGAVEFSATNKDIDIVFGEYAGYRFYGPDAPVGEIDTSKIAAVKFYIKCPDLENIETADVQLVYNSGSTGWVETQHDLNDGLIVDIEVQHVVEGDYFDAALATWSEEVSGTFSVEVLDADGNVLGEGVYTNHVYGANTEAETTEENTTEPEQTTAAFETTHETTIAQQITTVAAVGTTASGPARTGSTQMITAIVMTGISAFAIASMRKKNKK